MSDRRDIEMRVVIDAGQGTFSVEIKSQIEHVDTGTDQAFTKPERVSMPFDELSAATQSAGAAFIAAVIGDRDTKRPLDKRIP